MSKRETAPGTTPRPEYKYAPKEVTVSDRSGGGAAGARLPVGFRRDGDDAQLSLVYRRGRENAAVELAVSVVVVTGLIGLFTLSALEAGTMGAWAVALLAAGAGVALLLYAVGQVFNAVRFRVDDQGLEVREGPIPKTTTQHFARSDIAQVWVARHRPRTRPKLVRLNNETIDNFTLVLRDTQGRDHILLRMGRTTEQALYLEQELERALGLVDEEVAFEVSRD